MADMIVGAAMVGAGLFGLCAGIVAVLMGGARRG